MQNESQTASIVSTLLLLAKLPSKLMAAVFEALGSFPQGAGSSYGVPPVADINNSVQRLTFHADWKSPN